MEKRQKKDMNRVYTQFFGDEIKVESYPVQVVLHHMPEGLLYSSISTLDQKQIWSCEHTGKQQLSEYCGQKELGKEELRWIYGGVLENLKETQEFLLETDHLFLEPEEIYLDDAEHKVWNCFVPFYTKDVWQSMRELAQYLLGHLNRNDLEAVNLAYGLFQYFSREDCNIEGAWGILCEKKQPGKEEDNEQKEKEQKETEENPSFPIVKWAVMSLSGAAAVFLLACVAFNEWYLSNAGKILLLALAAILGCAGILAWKSWHPEMKKKNPMEEELPDIADADKEQVELVRVDTGHTIAVSEFPAIIGKLQEVAGIRIQEPAVSRIHGKLSCIQGKYYLEDLNSKNGTYVNGVRLEPGKPVSLKDQDILVFANVHYYFRL